MPDRIVNRFNLACKQCSVPPKPEVMNLLDLNDFSTRLNGGDAEYLMGQIYSNEFMPVCADFKARRKFHRLPNHEVKVILPDSELEKIWSQAAQKDFTGEARK
jgi:hypothetical protein